MFMLQKMHALSVAGASGAFAANAVDFDGANDYLLRGADLTGTSNTSTGIFSCWVRLDGGNAANEQLIVNASLNLSILRENDNKFKVSLGGNGGAGSLQFNTVATYTSGATWLHVLASWNTNFSAGNKLSHLYINDVSDKNVVSDITGAFNVTYIDTNWAVGSTTGAGRLMDGCLAEVYFAPGQFLDFSNSANRRKFISALGKPVDLGSDGSLPTGTAPIVYLNNAAASFGTNKGSGGNFTITGSLDAASTSPSD